MAVNYHDTPEGADQTVAAIRQATGAEAFAVRADVGKAADVKAMMAEVVERCGALDVLVNNAGVQTWTPFLEVTEEEWDLVIDTNLKGCFLCTQAAARQMKTAGPRHDRQHRIRVQQGCRSRGSWPTRRAKAASRC